MMLLQQLFSNPKFLEFLKYLGLTLLVILAVSVVGFYIAIPVWCLTHHVHHSAFTWFMVWFFYGVVGLAAIIGLMIAADA